MMVVDQSPQIITILFVDSLKGLLSRPSGSMNSAYLPATGTSLDARQMDKRQGAGIWSENTHQNPLNNPLNVQLNVSLQHEFL